jgi:phenylalanyl-tRNA synthetase beta chain
MRLSFNWLTELVEITDNIDVFAEKLTNRGLNVERVEEVQAPFSGVVVGEVTAVSRHTTSAHLHVCTVRAGDRESTVVCGAPNTREGMKSALALPGASLPGGKIIEPSEIGGVRSDGMLCSAQELGVGDNAEEILAFPASLAHGAELETALNLRDFILEIEVTHNRPDHSSVLGVAREVGALYGVRIKDRPRHASPADGAEKPEIRIEEPKGCACYAGRIMEHVSIGPSPVWLSWRLKNAGLRSVNNVVDIANYLLLETGQPTHCFDFSTLAGGTIIVRNALPGERLRTLDGVDRTLNASVLVIADAERAVALAGIMGGEETEVTATTTSVLIESAYFFPGAVRTGSDRLSLTTEASTRFIRGVDPGMVVPSCSLVASYIGEYAGGAPRGDIVLAGEPPSEPRRVSFRPERADLLIGESICRGSMARDLQSLGFAVEQGEQWTAEVPSYRGDVKEEVDIIEEIARCFGYDRVPTRNLNTGGLAAQAGPEERFVRLCRESLVRLGLVEIVTRTLVQPDVPRLFDRAEPVQQCTVQNPLNKDESYLRSTLLAGLLKAVSRNIRHDRRNARLFEVGKVFGVDADSGEVIEHYQAGIALTGAWNRVYWNQGLEEVNFFDLKGIAESFLSSVKVDSVAYECYDAPWSSQGRGLRVYREDDELGVLGAIEPSTLEALGIDQPVFCGSFNMDTVSRYVESQRRYVALARFPRVRRDLAFVVDEKESYAELESCIAGRGGPMLEGITLFDVYRGKPVPAGRKSVAFALSFRSHERTLSDAEVDDLMVGIRTQLTKDFSAEIRER